MKLKFKWFVLFLTAAALMLPMMAATPVMADPLADAIAAVPRARDRARLIRRHRQVFSAFLAHRLRVYCSAFAGPFGPAGFSQP